MNISHFASTFFSYLPLHLHTFASIIGIRRLLLWCHATTSGLMVSPPLCAVQKSFPIFLNFAMWLEERFPSPFIKESSRVQCLQLSLCPLMKSSVLLQGRAPCLWRFSPKCSWWWPFGFESISDVRALCARLLYFYDIYSVLLAYAVLTRGFCPTAQKVGEILWWHALCLDNLYGPAISLALCFGVQLPLPLPFQPLLIASDHYLELCHALSSKKWGEADLSQM